MIADISIVKAARTRATTRGFNGILIANHGELTRDSKWNKIGTN